MIVNILNLQTGLILNLSSLGELPAVIDFKPFDRDAGEHSFTVIANSTIGETANYTYTFYVQRM